MAKKKPLIIAGAAGLCAVLAGVFAFGENRPAADNIKNSSLIIGTYLIDFEALNEENQALAEKNAQDTNQNKVYYKSELNEGVWYDITDAESVSDITLTNSRIVDAAVIDSLDLTLYFKADGSVVDFTTGQQVSVQDVDGAYDPKEMSELSAVLKHHEMVKKQSDATADDDDEEVEKKHELYAKEVSELNYLFGKINDSVCTGLLRDMNSLDAVIASADGSAKESLVAVKMKKRAELESHCYGVVCDRIDNIITTLKNHDVSAHETLISLLSDAESEIQGSMSEAQSEIGSEPADAVGKKQAQLEEQLIAAANSGDSAAAEKAANTLAVLDAMINGNSTDSEAAAELSEEMMNELMDSIEETVTSILNGTHDIYKQGGSGMTSQEVLQQLSTDISDAQQLAKDKAFYNTGSTTSDEYNKELSEDLSSLGLLLSALSENSGDDELSKAVISAAAESADSVLSDAAAAEAASAPATDSQKKIDDLNDRLDSAYGKYLDALNSGNDALADSAMQQVEALQEQLNALRAEVSAEIGGLMSDLLGELNSASPDKDTIRALNAKISVDKDYLSDVDRALLEQTLASLEDMEDAVSSGSVSKSETAYDKLKTALQNVPDDLLDDGLKSEMLKYTASLIADNGILSAEECEKLLNDAKNSAAASSGDKAQLDKALAALKELAAAEKAADGAEKALSQAVGAISDSAIKNAVRDLADDISNGSASAGDAEKMINDAKNGASAADKAQLDKALEALKQLADTENAKSAAEKMAQALEAVSDENTYKNIKDELKSIADRAAGGSGDGSGAGSVNMAELAAMEKELTEAKKTASEADKAQLDKATEALNELKTADTAEKLNEAADKLEEAADGLSDGALSTSDKQDIMDYANSVAGSGSAGAGDFTDLLDEIMKDIASANNGEFTPNTDDIGDGTGSGSGGTGGIGSDGSISDSLFEYKLVIPSLNIYSNAMSIEKGGTVFIDMLALAREAGLQFSVSGDVYVFRGNDVLIELTPDSNIAYVGDKLFAPSAEPYFSGEVLYAPTDLVAAGLKLTVETENGTTFMR